MTAQWLVGWSNLIFILPFALGLLYLGVYTLSGWTFGEGDADADADSDVSLHLDADGNVEVDHDVDLSHDVDTGDVAADADADADADSDVDSDADADGDGDADEDAGQSSAALAALSWLGMGKVPISLMMMILLLSWGTIGFAANRVMIRTPVWRSAPIAIAIALVGSVLLTRLVSATVARFFPTTETYARRRHELLGSVGEALYPIDAKFGMVCGRDDRGEQFQVPCRTEPDGHPIAKGAKVILVGYNARDGLFSVIEAEAGDSGENPHSANRHRTENG